LDGLEQERVRARAESQVRRERRVEIARELNEDRDEVPLTRERAELVTGWGERRGTRGAGAGTSEPSEPRQASASSFFCSWALGTAPITWSATLPSLTNRIVGIERMPYRAARPGFSSTFTFASVTRPPDVRASSSRTGAMFRQGPHHSAQ